MQFAKIARKRCLRLSASGVSTGFVPLKEIKKAVVFVDGSLDDCESVLEDMRFFFSAKGVEVKAFALSLSDSSYAGNLAEIISSNNLNWYGRIKTNRKTPKIKHGEDLFISLLENPECFAALQAAVSSKARFKLGRFRDPVFDMVISGGNGSQKAAFKTISEILCKVCR